MRIRTFRSVLDECLGSVQRGEAVESCLQRYPRHADRLRPLLTLAAGVKRVPPVQARPWAQATAWDLVRQRATELRSGKRRRGTGSTDVGAGMWLRPLAVAMALVLAIFAGGGATALASQSALPDSPLYRVKLLTEDARLWFVFDDSREAEILLDQSDERMDEILAMARKGKPIPSNVLSAMESRHSRAAAIVADLSTADSDRPDLLRRLLEQSTSQEDTLLTLWDGVSPGGRDDYTEVVALLHNTRLQGSTELVLSSEDLVGGVREIDGVAVLADGVWTIGGIPVVVDERTIGGRELEDGATARGVFGQASNGTLKALSLISFGSPPAFVTGAVEEVSDEGIRIAGQWISFDSSTIVRKDLKLGDRVQVELSESESGTVASKVSGVATPVDSAEEYSLTFVGTIESPVSAADEVVVGGVTFAILENAKINASSRPAEEGARAIIEASYSGGVLTATGITILSADEDPGTIFLAGTYESTTEGLWVVSGVSVSPPEGADEPETGAVIAVDARRTDNDLATEEYFVIEEPGDDPVTTVSSTIKKLTGINWDIGIPGEVRVDKDSHVVGDPNTGDRVLIWGRQSNNQRLQAIYVRVLE